MKASWNDTVLAESEITEVVDGNHYFPAQSLNRDCLTDSEHTTVCGWKGTAHYYHVNVGGAVNENAAWYYPEPKEAAAAIKDHVAFWKGVSVA